MRTIACLPVLLLLGAVCAPAGAEIYKCREANGGILYTDTPCDPDAETLGIMPEGSVRFQPDHRWDPMAEDDPATLAAQEQALVKQLRQTQVEPGQSSLETTEVFALRRQLISLIKSIRRQKAEMQSRGLDEGEELIAKPVDDNKEE
jgi:hypothetical protein